MHKNLVDMARCLVNLCRVASVQYLLDFFFVVAHDSIVLDLTMQCIFCPWLCQAPWSLVCTVCLSYLDIYFNVSAFFQIFMYK